MKKILEIFRPKQEKELSNNSISTASKKQATSSNSSEHDLYWDDNDIGYC